MPAEHETMELQLLLQQCGSNYRQLRAIARLVWKTHLLMTAAKEVQSHYRVSKTASYAFLEEYLTANGALAELSGARQ